MKIEVANELGMEASCSCKFVPLKGPLICPATTPYRDLCGGFDFGLLEQRRRTAVLGGAVGLVSADDLDLEFSERRPDQG